jgi:NIPSNAP.
MSVASAPLSPIVELRRYRLKPGTRETLIDVFDREFIETQEDVGMQVIAQFRDIDDPDAFVWLRGFPDMESRRQSLAAFYGGPVWKAHGGVANATMVNSDNVLLLRPGSDTETAALARGVRPASGEAPRRQDFFTLSVAALAPGKAEGLSAFFAAEVAPDLERAGARLVATFLSEHAENTFPRLPVRAGETAFAWLLAFDDVGAWSTHVGRLAASKSWTGEVLPRLEGWLWRPLETVRLAPTDRSRLVV